MPLLKKHSAFRTFDCCLKREFSTCTSIRTIRMGAWEGKRIEEGKVYNTKKKGR